MNPHNKITPAEIRGIEDRSLLLEIRDNLETACAQIEARTEWDDDTSWLRRASDARGHMMAALKECDRQLVALDQPKKRRVTSWLGR